MQICITQVWKVISTWRRGDFGKSTDPEGAAKARDRNPGHLQCGDKREHRRGREQRPLTARPTGEPENNLLRPSGLWITAAEHQRLP